MHYIIDAYNVLFRSAYSKTSLEKDRYALIALLNSFAKERNCDITLVFDGTREAPLSVRTHYDAIELVYTHSDTNADTYIIELIEHKRPKNVTIVTNDKSLIRHIQAFHVKTMSCEEFLQNVYKKRKKKIKSISQKPSILKPKSHTSTEPSSLSDIDAWEKVFLNRLKEIENERY